MDGAQQQGAKSRYKFGGRALALTTENIAGVYEVRWQPRAAARSPILGLLLALLGFALLAVPVMFADFGSGFALAGVLSVEFLLLYTGYRLLREASGRRFRRIRLHVASGEMEVRSGRGLLSATRAFGAVEVECLILGPHPEPKRFALTAVTRWGPPVAVLPVEDDEGAAREVALVLSQGMGVPLSDRRFPDPEGRRDPPVRVGKSGEDRRTVYRWRYRDRFRPRLTFLGLSFVAALASVLPLLAREIGTAMIFPAVLDTLLALLLATHALATLTERRLTLRRDAFRIERHLGLIPLMQRLVVMKNLAGIVVLKKGPWCVVHLRLAESRTGVVLPFEEFAMATWLKSLLETAAHGSGTRRAAPG